MVIFKRLKSIKNYPILYILLIILILRLLFYSTLVNYNIASDSPGYIDYPLKDFFSLNFTSGRTPIYSIIIQLLYYIFGENLYLNALIILQGIVSFLSVIYFYKACKLIIKYDIATYLATIFYGLTPAIMGWDNTILTESFALSGTTFLIYLIIKYIKKPTFKYGITAITLMLILTFLRPSFILFNILIFVFWIIRLIYQKKERKLLFKLVISSTIVFCIIISYSYIFMQSYGIFSISDPVPRQQLIICINREYYKSSDNQEFINMIDEGIEIYGNDQWSVWSFISPIIDKFGLPEILRLSKDCINKNIKQYAIDTVNLMIDESLSNLHGVYKIKKYENQYAEMSKNIIINTIEGIFSIFKVVHVYLFIIIELILSIYLWIKNKRPNFIHLGIFTFLFSITISTFIGTCAEYPRTMICVLPFIYLSVAIYIDNIIKFNKLKNLPYKTLVKKLK